MKKSNSILSNSVSDIISINRKENGKYEVYFKFLSVPVIMNKGYLESLISNKKEGANTLQLA